MTLVSQIFMVEENSLLIRIARRTERDLGDGRNSSRESATETGNRR